MKVFVRLVAASVFGLMATVVSGLPLGCSDSDSTTGKRVGLSVTIAASPESKQFTNAAGWSVALTKAEIATGALYFFDGETLFAHARPRPKMREFVTVRSAFAHPGHYVPGNAKGEMLTPSSADLLTGGTLGRGNGVSGPVRSATFSFDSPAKGAFAADLGSNVVVLEGAATKGGETRIFRAELTAEDVKDGKGRTQIEGCPFTEADMQSDGVVSVSVKLTTWFDQVDFGGLAASGDGKAVLMSEGLARNQLVRGVKVGAGYVFAYQEAR